MCRGPIQLYFKVQDEPFIDDTESDFSNELKRMSVGEILRGVFFCKLSDLQNWSTCGVFLINRN